MKSSRKLNLLYTLDKNGMLKVTDLLKGDIRSSIKLGDKKVDSVRHFDMDEAEQNIVFNKNLNVYIYNIEKNSFNLMGTVTSEINHLSYSSDGKFIITSTNKDYFLYLWHRKNMNEPLITLQLNSLTNANIMKHIEKGVYHLFSYNKSVVYGYNLILEEIDPKVPVKPNLEITFPEKNLIQAEIIRSDNTNSSQSLFILYGKTFSASNLFTKVVKYSKNSKIFKEKDLSISTKSADTIDNKGGVKINPSAVRVLNEIQMNRDVENDKSSTDIDNEYKIANDLNVSKMNGEIQEADLENQKISLINMIRNSIINNDNSSFEWALDQKDYNLVETTIKKMDKELIKGFISKLIETFQSSVFFKRNMLPWLDLLFKYHLIEIVNLPKNTLANLKKIQTFIKNRTKNLERLTEVSSKLEGLIKIAKANKSKANKKTVNTKLLYEPMLVYNESDSENEIKKKVTIQMKKKGITKTTEKKFKEKRKVEENVEMLDEEGMEDNFEDELMMEEDFLNYENENIIGGGIPNEDEEMEDDRDDEVFEDDDI